MDFYEAKKILEDEDVARLKRYQVESKARIAAGSPHVLDRIMVKTYPNYKDVYWAVWRFSRDIIKGYKYRKLKSVLQRVRGGYGVQDVWNLDMYLAGLISSALRELKNSSVGFPMSVKDFDGTILYESGWDTDKNVSTGPETEECCRIWEDTLERMAFGFDAHSILGQCGWTMDTESELEMQRFEREGLMLFVNNYSSLWD